MKALETMKALVCRFCGKDLPAFVPPQPSPPNEFELTKTPLEEKTKMRCMDCGCIYTFGSLEKMSIEGMPDRCPYCKSQRIHPVKE